MNFLSEAIASYKRSDFARALRLFEQAGELYGRHVIEANILMCRKALGEPKGHAAITPAISNARSTSPSVDSAAMTGDAIAEQAAIVRAALFDNKNSKRLSEVIRYPTSPASEGLVDLLLASPSLDHAQGVRQIHDAFKLGRYAIVERWLNEALVEHFGDVELHMLAVRLDYVRGNYEQVVDKLLTLLAKNNGFSEALQLLAQAYSRQGRFLEAMATLTNGRGLTAWLNSSPTMEQAKLAAQLDWVSVAMTCEAASANFVGIIEKSCSVTGLPLRLVDAAYSLFFIGDRKIYDAEGAGLFQALRERTACTQIACIDPSAATSEIECVGQWAFVFKEEVAVDAVLLDAIFAQKRKSEAVVKIMQCRMDASGVPASFHVAGVLASAEALRVFGEVSLMDWLKAAERSLRVKTVLI